MSTPTGKAKGGYIAAGIMLLGGALLFTVIKMTGLAG